MDALTPSTRRKVQLPDELVQISRVTQNWLALRAEFARDIRLTRRSYETMEGGVFAYSQSQEGFFGLRPVGIPPAMLPSVTYTYGVDLNGRNVYFGAIRKIDEWDFGSEPVMGTYGIPRGVPRHFPSGRFGGFRTIVPDDNALRVEFYRLGRSLYSEPFELPDRAVKYCEYWALYRAYSAPNEGEEKVLADHYKGRYQAGVKRMENRVKAQMDERTMTMGGKRQNFVDSYLALFYGDYGYARPARR